MLNHVHEVDDSDNIKQDMSIDVYGRDKDEKVRASPGARRAPAPRNCAWALTSACRT